MIRRLFAHKTNKLIKREKDSAMKNSKLVNTYIETQDQIKRLEISLKSQREVIINTITSEGIGTTIQNGVREVYLRSQPKKTLDVNRVAELMDYNDFLSLVNVSLTSGRQKLDDQQIKACSINGPIITSVNVRKIAI